MIKVKIYYHDTDCAGVVYYANYLKYFEQARTEFFAQRGFSVKGLAESGTFFVVSRQEIDYKAPAGYGDVLEIQTSVVNTSGVKIEFAHETKKADGEVICQAKTTLVCVDKDFKPKAMPEDLKRKIA